MSINSINKSKIGQYQSQCQTARIQLQIKRIVWSWAHKRRYIRYLEITRYTMKIQTMLWEAKLQMYLTKFYFRKAASWISFRVFKQSQHSLSVRPSVLSLTLQSSDHYKDFNSLSEISYIFSMLAVFIIWTQIHCNTTD